MFRYDYSDKIEMILRWKFIPVQNGSASRISRMFTYSVPDTGTMY